VQGIRQYLWHTFSSENYPAVSGDEAEECYAAQSVDEVVVLSNDRDSALLTNALPTWCSQMDYCVFPLDLSWTMAFTHEAGWLGPYFAKHPDHNLLLDQANRQRQAKARKSQGLERAKKNGWI
jgi:hypothetical protein